VVEVGARPSTGQFIMMWEYNGLPWSLTYKFIDNVLHRYERHLDDYEVDYEDFSLSELNPTYYII